jgi:signal transduction histidine kinase/DNA-binding response OmpR family regulator
MHEPISGPQSTEDVTRHEGESTAREPGALEYRLLFEKSPDVLLVLLPDAPRYTMVAATDARLTVTHTARDILGRGLFEVFPDNPDDPAATGTRNLRESLERVLKTRLPDTMPVQRYDIRGPDGDFQSRYWSPKNLPLLSPSGQLLYILHRVEDVTELVRANERGDELRGQTREMEREVIRRSHELAAALRELREANAKLAQLDAAKTAFFSNISHEFRTPLTLMLGPLEEELAADTGTDPALRRRRLETAHRNCLRLLKLVNALLDFARVEAGRMQARYEPTDLASLTAELASQFRSAAERAGLTLTIDCRQLPEPIYVDRDMWEKIVLNLLSNALKHTFRGGIAARVEWVDNAARLAVQDTGAGIPKEEIPRLFERFHRVPGAASRSHEGSGIGLSLVREFVDLHSGTIRVESELGRGSCFVVSLQAGTAHLPADKLVHEPQERAVDRSASPYVEEAAHWLPSADSVQESEQQRIEESARPRARVLWADDNGDMREYVASLLRPYYEVTAVSDGEAALQSAREAVPDLVLSDVMMPRMDGVALLKALRDDERTRGVPVILLSARAGEEATVEGLDAGADDYLIKPFSARELLARVRAHVEIARERRAWEAELERRVAERTAELTATAESLAHENAVRQAAELRLQAQLQRMSLLDHITRAVAERQDLGSVFEVVIANVEESLPAEACWIGLTGPETQNLAVGTELRYEPDLERCPLSLPSQLAGRRLRSLVIAPLRVDGDVLGAVLAGRRGSGGFSSADCEFLRQLSEHIALAVRQGQLRESLQTAYDDLRRSQQAVLQQERLSALGQMASGIAHDINNAISPATLYLETLLRVDADLTPQARQYLPLVLRAMEDVAATVARMREFYRPREAEPALAPADLNLLVGQVVELTRARWSDMPQQRGVVISASTELSEQLPPVVAIESEIREALINLIFNAVDAMPDGGALTVRTAAAGQCAWLEVEDTGVGMDRETSRRCLEPFFTTKGERGTGLGLAMVYGVIKRHGADIQIDSAPGKGTRIRITFPPASASAAAADAFDGSTAVPCAPLRILIIDDDPLVLKSLQEALEGEGHIIAAASDPRDGLERFRAALATDPFAIVVTDLGMPHLDGRAVARAVKEASPGTPVILLTGWGPSRDPNGGMPHHVDCVLGKPPKLRELRAALAECASISNASSP